MSSRIKVQRICLYCSNEFTARTTVTKYCCDYCAKMAYKQREREMKIQRSNNETTAILRKPIEELKAKEFLTVKEVAALLNCSTRSVYNRIGNKQLKAINLSQRLTRVKRSDIDNLFA